MEIPFRKLIFLETILASMIFLVFAVYAQTIMHIALSAVLAPFLLLRSSESEISGRACFEKFMKEIEVTPHTTSIALKTLILTFAGLFTRAFFSIFFMKKGIANIPNNLFRIVMQESLFSRLEFVPGTGSIDLILKKMFDKKASLVKYLTVYFLGRIIVILATLSLSFVFVIMIGFVEAGLVTIPYIDNYIIRMLMLLSIVILFIFFATLLVNSFASIAEKAIIIICYFFSFWYRLSLKATAVLWLPLVYLAWRAPTMRVSSSDHLLEEKQGALSALFRIIAWVSVVFLLWRAFVFPQFYETWQGFPASEYLDIFVLPIGTRPSSLHPYHIASGLNGIYVLLVYFFFIDGSARKLHDPQIVRYVDRWYPRYYWSRGAISIYTSVCGLYFAVQGALLLEWPHIAWCPFPWSCPH